MRHTIPIPRTHECEHGERTDRLTSEGLPACPLCRTRHTTAPTTDYRTLQAGDDTHHTETIDVDDIIATILAENPTGHQIRARLRHLATLTQ